MDRYWLLTWTTYGTWLPGDRRGFVSPVQLDNGMHVTNNVPGTPYDSNLPRLETAMRDSMKGAPIRLTAKQADAVLSQFRETAEYRGWKLIAAAVMANHAHVLVGVEGDPEPDRILHSFKSYASRALNRRWPRPANGTWWTGSGSTRKLPDEQAVSNALAYVRNQDYPLVVWSIE